MSFRNMLKVSSILLLAMALAATSAHARLDLFGQLLTSKNQPDPNYGEEKIPYQTCIRTCAVCACDKRPTQYSECVCKKPITAEPLGAEKIPYQTCIRTCAVCACDTRPTQYSECVCKYPLRTKPLDDDSEEEQVQLKEKSNEVDESMTRMPYRNSKSK